MTPGKYPDTPPRVARKRGDRRPGSLKADLPMHVARSAAQRRLGALAFKRPGQGARKIPPKSGY